MNAIQSIGRYRLGHGVRSISDTLRLLREDGLDPFHDRWLDGQEREALYGVLVKREIVEKQGINQQTQEPVTFQRRVPAGRVLDVNAGLTEQELSDLIFAKTWP